MEKKATFRSPVHKLEDDQIYVYFGNTVGRIESTTAYKLFGAKIGRIDGVTGKCYAICSYKYAQTHDEAGVPEEFLRERIKRFYQHANKNPNLKFLVEFGPLDEIMTLRSRTEMGDLFSDYLIPKNVIFEEEFNKYIV